MAEPSRPARLWYQSFVHPVEQAPYIGRLQGLLDAVAGPGNRFEVHGLDPPDHLFHPLTEFRCAAQTIRNALEAERDGCDAFVIGHFQEPGLLEIRGALDIPVIGLGEATMLAALSMGRRIGLVTIDPVFIEWHERQVRAYGLEQRVAGVRAIQMDLPGFMRAFTDDASYAQARANFVEQVRPLVAAGAEVIIPAGGLPMLLFARECPFRDRRRAGAQRHRGGGKGHRDGAGAAPPHRFGGQPPRHLRQSVGCVHRGVSRLPLVNDGFVRRTLLPARPAQTLDRYRRETRPLGDLLVLLLDNRTRGLIGIEATQHRAWNPAIGALRAVFIKHVEQHEFGTCSRFLRHDY